MWYEVFKFELKYRIKRPETYVFFGFLLLFSIFGVDFIFQGVEIGQMKMNAPLVIAKTMGALTGILMILVSIIMGVPVLRDYQYETEALLFINPITKRDYLLGKFLGSFTVLLFIFSGLLLGMMVGSQMPWHKEEQMLAFDIVTYVQPFAVVVIPTLFFGACAFFVTGMLSKKLLVVYTQGIVIFVVFLLTKAITNEYLQGILDPFSLTTLTQYSKDWSVSELNATGITLRGILLHSKLLWSGSGVLILIFGYRKFSFSTLSRKKKKHLERQDSNTEKTFSQELKTKNTAPQYNFKAQCYQLYELSRFYLFALLKETSFWAIVICGIVIIVANSINLGTVYGVDSYPATHFIIAELQEMSMYFFIIILLFYSGELIWKERNLKQYVLNDATPANNLVTLASKFIALNAIYVVLMLSLMVTGILFQVASGYYEFELDVYFSGFFIEILPFLILYTFIAFFLQVISKNKFIGIFLTLIFFMANIGSEFLGFNHSLYKFGGKPLGIYSEMNGYGHFLKPYLWIKAYWLIFGILLLLLSSLLLFRGTEVSVWKRLKSVKTKVTKPMLYSGISAIALFVMIGSYIFYNTNILNTYWSNEEEQNFRARYEKTLKHLEYFPQPKITDVKLMVELYPESRSYKIDGTYTLKNTTEKPINEIHIQKLMASHVVLENIHFDSAFAKAETPYSNFDYTVYKLKEPLPPNVSLTMDFKQTYQPQGFEDGGSNTQLVYNGTFFNNNILPSLGYNKSYELSDEDDRTEYQLPIRPNKAKINNPKELVNARSGSDSDGITLDVTFGTSDNQTAVTSGKLVKQWIENNRNYFHYKSEKPIINFYAMVSADYEVKKDKWAPFNMSSSPVDLEIYYHKGHSYNLDRIMSGMKASLSYYSTHFSPYQYEQLRIMEFPRYADFAQSLPNAIPFSEAMGFVLDIDDEKDIDMAFYITAHEIAHQWFGIQIESANVQGQKFILETLAQYGALMVFKEKYPKEKVEQFLELQKEEYDKKLKKAKSEPSLALVENEDFVYYNKGAIAMYKLREYIGEENVNLAIKRFIQDWDSYQGSLKMKTKRYATSKELLEYFRAVTPSDLQYVIKNLFETNSTLELNE